MQLAPADPMPHRCVVIHVSGPRSFRDTHEGVVMAALGRVLSGLKACDFDGFHEPEAAWPDGAYVIPDDALTSETASRLGIRSADDLYGGVVPRDFVKTKVITHELVAADADRPEGWCEDFAGRTACVVLPGFSVFSARDAGLAFEALRANGLVRAKRPLGTGGRDQTLLASDGELRRLLASIAAPDLRTQGLVLETNLDPVRTLSVGQVTAAGLTLSYHGTQRLTKDNQGRSVYGGSDLVVARGGWEALGRLGLADNVRLAVTQARTYDAALALYPGFVASRRNYDVAQGWDGHGRWRSGVLEHSCRIGGASGAEVEALLAFAGNPTRSTVNASTVEVYGPDPQPPPADARVLFHGIDPLVGPILRYTLLREGAA